MSTTSGASPSTVTRHPVGITDQAGSRSAVTYQVARNCSSSCPSRIPDTVVRCAATVPASIVPAAMRVVVVATATSPSAVTSSSGTDRASATSRSDGPKLSRRCAAPADVGRRRRAAVPHDVEQQLRGVARRHVGELLDRDAIDAALDRGERERHGLGDEPRTAPGGVDRRAARLAGPFDAGADVGGDARRVVEHAGGRHDVDAVLEQPAERVDVGEAGPCRARSRAQRR